jgi:hypothetical protein
MGFLYPQVVEHGASDMADNGFWLMVTGMCIRLERLANVVPAPGLLFNLSLVISQVNLLAIRKRLCHNMGTKRTEGKQATWKPSLFILQRL